MRIYNGTNSQLDLPLSGIQRITIPEHSVSGDLLPSTEFLSLLVTSFNYNEIAIIVSGPYEINMCAGVTGCVGFVVQSLEEAIEKFTPKKKEEVVTCCNCHQDPCCCDKKESNLEKKCCEETTCLKEETGNEEPVEKKRKPKKKEEENQ